MTEQVGAGRDRIGGGALIAAALGTVLAMSHHPSGMHGGGLGGIVHGAMIALLGVLSFGFLRFAQQRGFERPLILAGAIAYLAAFLAHVGAATINGFIVPALTGGEPPVSHDLFRFAWHSNQALAKLGVVATGLAYLGWGLDLAGNARMRWIGLAGVVAGIVPAALLAAGAITMNVTGAFIAYAAHALWAVLLGAAMWRGMARD
jgi:hypothetical protein